MYFALAIVMSCENEPRTCVHGKNKYLKVNKQFLYKNVYI